MGDGSSAPDTSFSPLVPWRFTVVVNLIGAVTIVLAVFFTYSGVFPFQSPLGVYRLLPGDIMIDLVWTYVIALVCGVVVVLFSAPLARLFWYAHRIAKGGNQNYYIQRRTGNAGISPHRRLFTPAIAALGFAFSLSSPTVQSLVFVTENFTSLGEHDFAIRTAMPVLFISILVATFVLLIFTPIWLLEDAGLITEKKTTGSRVTADIEGVGQFFIKYLRGFAGLSTVIGYLLLGVQMVDWYQAISANPELMYPLFVYFIPVTVVFAAPLIVLAPISIVNLFYETSLKKNARSLVSQMTKSGLPLVTVEPLTHQPNS
ncbi:MAG: hypothetical protein HXY34_10750 [Candidatus Thorarchaeota archaeon]|nr:hypothetical protein [Candidatus Thorarchaeota archaeon]